MLVYVYLCILIHIRITCLLWPNTILLDPKTNLIFLQLSSLQKQIFDAHADAAIYLLHCIWKFTLSDAISKTKTKEWSLKWNWRNAKNRSIGYHEMGSLLFLNTLATNPFINITTYIYIYTKNSDIYQWKWLHICNL